MSVAVAIPAPAWRPAWPFARPPFDVAKRVALWLAAGLTMLSGYGLTKLEPLGPAVELPLTSLDLAVPFVPWAIWYYGTASWAALIAFLQAPNRLECRRLYFSVALAAVCCWWFFLLFPTTYPRELYPLPAGDSWTLAEFRSLRAKDSPSNCFPSQHVALAWSLGLVWAGFQRNRLAKVVILAWACLVTLGTLTTKQHYVWDLPPGFLIGIGAAALVRWGIRDAAAPTATRAIGLSRDSDLRAISALRARVEAHQWRLDELAWPAPGSLAPLDPRLVRLVNHVIWIEEIAGLNFRLLRDAADGDDLRALYDRFADEERRHADGLRRLLVAHGAPTERPGLGNALVLDQFDTLSAGSTRDAVLVAAANPVFETFLDAGTIPFLQTHPAFQGPLFDAFVERVNRDEGAHLATNWLVTREMARRHGGLRGLWLVANPNAWRGAIAVGPMALDVYTVAWSLGFRFESLYPAFDRLWRLHLRHPELGSFSVWWLFRLFVVFGACSTWVCATLARAGVLGGWLWIRTSRVTDHLAWWAFGDGLLVRRGLQRPSVA